jgi:hypothetical protein
LIIRPPFSEAEKSFLRENYLYLSDNALAEILGSTNGVSIRKIRSNMGLRRNKKAMKDFTKEVPLVIWVQRELYDSKEFTGLKNISI